MQTFLLVAVLGAIAQLVDGSLGMAYGVTSTTLLIAAGTSPAIASASVHLAEIGTTLASGLSHWRLGNVNWRVVALISGPGAIGAFLGATVLSRLSTEGAEPYVAGLLLLLGVYVLVRFLFGIKIAKEGRPTARFLGPLGLVAGFVDATGGGGWGPIATPTLIASGKLDPRRTVGSVDTAEFVVAVAASLGFFFGLAGGPSVQLPVVLALLVGGVIAAPFAAWLVRLVPTPVLGTLVGGIVILTNARTILGAVEAPTPALWTVYPLVVAIWAAAVTLAVVKVRRDRRADAEPEVAPVPA